MDNKIVTFSHQISNKPNRRLNAYINAWHASMRLLSSDIMKQIKSYAATIECLYK